MDTSDNIALDWIALKNECIISYFEKKLENKQYILGSEPKRQPHYKLFYNKYTYALKEILTIVGLAVIIYRTTSLGIAIVAALDIFLWILLSHIIHET
jgi:hypothetical protein